MHSSSRQSLMSHIVASHLADEAQESLKIRILDTHLSRLTVARDYRYNYEAGVALPKCWPEKTIQIRTAEFQYVKKGEPMHEFKDVYSFVKYLLFKERVDDFETIRLVVKEALRRGEKDVKVPEKFPEIPLITDSGDFMKKQGRSAGETDEDIATLLLEMHNYAAKCVSDGILSIEQSMNLHLADILPGEIDPEPSTENTSGEKKSVKEETKYYRGKEIIRDTGANMQGPVVGKNIHKEMMRRSLKTAGPSPERRRGTGVLDEPVPRQQELYLAKRSPMIMQTPPHSNSGRKIEKMSHAKPSYKSRGPSPGRKSSPNILTMLPQTNLNKKDTVPLTQIPQMILPQMRDQHSQIYQTPSKPNPQSITQPENLQNPTKPPERNHKLEDKAIKNHQGLTNPKPQTHDPLPTQAAPLVLHSVKNPLKKEPCEERSFTSQSNLNFQSQKLAKYQNKLTGCMRNLGGGL